MKPEISVIMSTYNEKEQYIRESIESILNQTFKDFEFIIVLDNPENEMIKKVLLDYSKIDSRIKLLFNKKNEGLTESLNIAWKIAEADYIARMDADDISEPNRLQIEYNIMLSKNLDLIATSKLNISENGKNLGKYVDEIKPSKMKFLLPYDNSICHPTVLMKKKVLIDLNGYRDISSCEDYDLWIRMLCKGYKIEIIPAILIKCRFRHNSILRCNEYKRYVSDNYVKQLYKYYIKYNKIPSFQHFIKYSEHKFSDINSVSKFNEAYSLYKIFIDNMRRKKLGHAVFYFAKSLFIDIRILDIFLCKIHYHIRKYVVLKWI